MRWLAVIHFGDGSSWSHWFKSRRKARRWARAALRAPEPDRVYGVAIVCVAK
jgi:hypothetical protein